MDDPASSILLFLQHTENVASITLSEALIDIGAIFVLVLLNAFFVASEFALVSVRKTRVQKLAGEGNGGAITAIRLLEKPTRFISAVQLGVTLASLGLGLIGEPTIVRIIWPIAGSLVGESSAAYFAHGVSVVISFAIVTFLHVVLGELVPKMFALEKAESFAIIASRPLELFARIFSPVLWVFNYAGRIVGRVLGLTSSLEHTSVYTEEEIRQLINLSQVGGQINVEEQTLINKVFEFSETTVKEAMIPRTEIVAIPESSTFDEIASAFNASGFSRLPVFRGSLDDVAGFVHSKDLVAHSRRPKNFTLAEALHKPSYVVDTARLEDVLRQMQKEKFHFGFVVDEHGGVEGIITLEDLLEEIVGDISDEHDVEVSEQIDEQNDGTFLLDGGLAVRDLNRRLDMNLPISESYTTIAGFLMSEAGEILNVGQTVGFNGHTFTVEKVEKRRIIEVRMTVVPPEG